MLLDEIMHYLDDENVGTIGDDLYAGTMPPEPTNCIAIYEYPGEEPVQSFGNQLPPNERPRMQFKVRSKDYEWARLKADVVWRKLVVVIGRKLRDGGTPEKLVEITLEPLQSPFNMGSDEAGHVFIGANFAVLRELIA